MSQNMGQVQFQVIKLSPMIKKLIIINVAIWFGIQTILEGFILSQDYFTQYFSFTPKYTIENFFLWQPFTYMFLHSGNVFHVLLNMFSLYMFGCELEYRWGSKAFLSYYLVSGVGAAFIYLIGVIAVGLFQGHEPVVYVVPILGASGAVFGILLAYGILFGERVIYFFGLVPLKAKYLVMIIGAVEVMTLLRSGLGGTQVANLAHIGGLVTGYLYLLFWTRFQQRRWRGSKKSKSRRNLRLVVNNDDNKDESEGPKYWN